jgi:methionine biosynthesis protein MetW
LKNYEQSANTLGRPEYSDGDRKKMSTQSGHLFPTHSSLKVKLRKAYAYLFEGFPFDAEIFDYDGYWDRISQENVPPMPAFKLKLIEGIVDEGSRVLDIGCGDGTLLDYLRKTKGIEAHGIEIGAKAIELATAKGILVDRTDITQQEFQLTQTYDFIIASEVIEHLPRPEELMVKLRGRFRKYLIITLPNTGFVTERLRLLLGRFPKQWVLHPSEHLRFWTVTDFIFWCEQLGFKVENYYGMLEEYYDIKVKLWKYYPKLFSRFILYKVAER